ncbi:MAG: PIN domain-containing protein [Gemmataceae bacterium]|nr:PIN domain-containing protein [Gemmataceae bacterium]
MNAVFADTFYFIALLSTSDEGHAQAVEWTRQFTGRIVTTEWVLTELADGLATSRQRTQFEATRRKLLTGVSTEVVPLDRALYEQGVALYVARPDKEWSLTDCISFVVMQQEGIYEALTGDHHFEQAGFVALLK